MCKAYSPDSSEKYAIRRPSGAHAGSRSMTPGVLVRLRVSPCEAGSCQDFAMRLEERPHAGWRDVRIAQFAADVGKVRPYLRHVTNDVDIDALRFRLSEIVEEELAKLVIDNSALGRAGAADIEAAVSHQLAHLLFRGIVAIERYRAIAIRKEINLIADPHGIEIVGVLSRDFLRIKRPQIDDAEKTGAAATISFPRDVAIE